MGTFLAGVVAGVLIGVIAIVLADCKRDQVCCWWNWLFRIEKIVDGKRYSTYGAVLRHRIYYKTPKGQWFTAYRGPEGTHFELETKEDVRLALTKRAAERDDEKLRQLLRDEFGEVAPEVVAG